jgi:hypothetical protein
MLYTNTVKNVYTRTYECGVIYTKTYELMEITFTSIGEDGYGRKEIFLPFRNVHVANPPGLLSEKVLTGYSIYVDDGMPYIGPEDNKLYLILSSYGCYTKHMSGITKSLRKNKGSSIATAYGAFGKDGKSGIWFETIYRAEDGDVYFVRKSGGERKQGHPDIIFVKDGGVHTCKMPHAYTMFQHFGVNTPYTIYGGGLVDEEWIEEV